MGGGIAQVLAAKGHEVLLNDVDEARIRKGIDGIAKRLDRDVEKGKIVVDALPQPARIRVPALAGAPGAGGSVWDHVPPANMIADPAQYSP